MPLTKGKGCFKSIVRQCDFGSVICSISFSKSFLARQPPKEPRYMSSLKVRGVDVKYDASFTSTSKLLTVVRKVRSLGRWPICCYWVSPTNFFYICTIPLNKHEQCIHLRSLWSGTCCNTLRPVRGFIRTFFELEGTAFFREHICSLVICWEIWIRLSKVLRHIPPSSSSWTWGKRGAKKISIRRPLLNEKLPRKEETNPSSWLSGGFNCTFRVIESLFALVRFSL